VTTERVAGPVHPLDGSDAPGGLPPLSGLPLVTRAVIETSAFADVALRTAAASLVSGAVLSFGLGGLAPGRIATERASLELYRELAEGGDAQRTFPRPAAGVDVRSSPAGPVTWRPREGRVEALSFRSAFTTMDPAQDESYARSKPNRTAWAQYWHHDDGPRPTLCVIHGFMGSPYWLNSAFFSLPWFYTRGYDVLLYTLPFHGQRQGRLAPYSGYGYFAHGPAHVSEAMAQAVHDFRVFVDFLEARGVAKIGVTGLSLGGYTSALLAAVDDRLLFSVPNAPAVDMPKLIDSWVPARQVVDGLMRLYHLPREDFDASLAVHCPLTYAPVIPKERRMIIAGLGDRLAPPEQSEELWEHWDHCILHWFPGNHVLHVNRGCYLRRMARFMRSVGFDS